MKILIQISPEHYDGSNKCTDSSPTEYAILKNGVVIRRVVEDENRSLVAVLCDQHQAHNMLVLARSLNSPIVEDIQRALDPLPDL